MNKSLIEWTQATWNPVTGCTKISKGCEHCYAERISKRLAGRYGYPKQNPFQVTIHPDRLQQPYRWPGRQMIFVCSMGDLFHVKVSDSYIRRVIQMIRNCPNHIFQVLTKRDARLKDFSAEMGRWPENAWVGVTVESPEYAHRIDALRAVDASTRFLSLEPLLGDPRGFDLNGIGLVIVGGESGPDPRPMEKAWAISARDMCVEQGIPFFFKQWGGRNKKAAGRKLNGREWNQLPALSDMGDLFK